MKVALKAIILCIFVFCLVIGLNAQDLTELTMNDLGLQGAATHGLIQSINSQFSDGVTVTLTHAYADANRVALWYTIDGVELPEGDVKGRFVNPLLLTPEGAWFGTGAMNGGVTPLDPINAPNQYLVTFDHTEDYPADGYYHLIFRLQVGGTIWVLPEGFTQPPGRLPDEYRVDIPASAPFEFPLLLPASAPIVLQPNQTVESNGITMTLQKLRIAPSQSNLSLCFTIPDERDWQPDVTISLDNEEGVRFSGSQLVEPSALQNQRCIDVNALLYYDSSFRHMTITVNRLQTPLAEWIPAVTQHAQASLRQQGIEIEFFFGEHGAGFNILNKPDDMTEADLSLAIHNVLSESYSGTWVFEVDLP